MSPSSPPANSSLQVQALTPQSGNEPLSVSPPSSPNLPFLENLPSVNLTNIIVIASISATVILVILFITVRHLRQTVLTLTMLLMLSAVPISVYIANQQTNLQSQAGPNYTPKNISVNQVTSHSFTLLWDTDSPDIGVVRIRMSPDSGSFNQIFQEAETGEIYKHILKIDQLQPATDYYFEILSGGIWYNQQGQPLKVTTASL